MINRWMEIQKSFEDTFEQFKLLLDSCEQPEVAHDDFAEIISSNLIGGKHIRGALVAAALEAFSTREALSASRLQVAHFIGWCIEMMHTGFLVLDDIMDNSPTRRNKPSWFVQRKEQGFGSLAINDGIHLIMASKYLLHQVFRLQRCSQDVYFKITKLFDEGGYRTCWGQHLDAIYSKPTNCAPTSIDNFTKPHVDAIAKWKTGFYTFYLPIACGMIMAEVNDETRYSQASNILLKFGIYFQAQDDYLDCFGSEVITGKVGTDITDGKCTWLIAECLAQATPKQRQIIQFMCTWTSFLTHDFVSNKL
ncbi:unnamed protein product [Dicrocoelium dendriticum]|nr:unnamed protein product [Dicrocoelium dendriticum]